MKAKEEYVDAPRETRSKDITVYAIIFLVLLVGAGIFLAVRLLHKPADAALADSKSGIVYDSSAVEGGWDNLSPEEIVKNIPSLKISCFICFFVAPRALIFPYSCILLTIPT